MTNLTPTAPPPAAPLAAPTAAVADAIRASVAPNTARAYRSALAAWQRWAEAAGRETMPADPAAIAEYLAERAAGDPESGRKPASAATLGMIRAALAAAHKAAGLPDPTDCELIRRTLRGLRRTAGTAQRQAAPPLTATGLAAVRATAQPFDFALCAVMRDALLRISEVAALRWQDVSAEADGSGRLAVRHSKTDQDGAGATLYIGPEAMAALDAIRNGDPDSAAVFGLQPRQLANRIKAAAAAAGLGSGFSGHSARVCMAQDLAAAGCELPALMQAGRWQSSAMPARYTARQAAGRGAVAAYYSAAVRSVTLQS